MIKKSYYKVCAQCKDPFTTIIQGKIYCCAACVKERERQRSKDKRAKESIKKTCAHCGKGFHSKRAAHYFCSVDCRYARARALRKEEKIRRRDHIRLCSVCKKEFENINLYRKTCESCRRKFIS